MENKAQQLAASHLRAAIEAIDAEFGAGYARDNPELVAAMLQASAIESAKLAGVSASRETNETLLKLKPRLFG